MKRKLTQTNGVWNNCLLEIQRGNAVAFELAEEEPTTEEQVTEQGRRDWEQIDADSFDLLENDPVSNPFRK